MRSPDTLMLPLMLHWLDKPTAAPASPSNGPHSGWVKPSAEPITTTAARRAHRRESRGGREALRRRGLLAWLRMPEYWHSRVKKAERVAPKPIPKSGIGQELKRDDEHDRGCPRAGRQARTRALDLWPDPALQPSRLDHD